jgi:hypothetical protein
MTAAVACTQCGALTAKQCTCKPDFSFQKLENITWEPQPVAAYNAIVEQQQKARRAERLEVASRVLAGMLANPSIIDIQMKLTVPVSLATRALEIADALVAAVDAKP